MYTASMQYICIDKYIICKRSDRTELRRVQNWSIPFGHLKAHMTIKTQAEPAFGSFLVEIERLMAEQERFTTCSQSYIVECEMMDKVQEIYLYYAKHQGQTPPTPSLFLMTTAEMTVYEPPVEEAIYLCV